MQSSATVARPCGPLAGVKVLLLGSVSDPELLALAGASELSTLRVHLALPELSSP